MCALAADAILAGSGKEQISEQEMKEGSVSEPVAVEEAKAEAKEEAQE